MTWTGRALALAVNFTTPWGAARSQTIRSDKPVVVASKPFGESYLLAEMFAQLLEARGIAGRAAARARRDRDRVRRAPEGRDRRLSRVHRHRAARDPARAARARPARGVRAGSRASSATGSASGGCRRSASRTPTPSRCAARPPSALDLRTLSDLARVGPTLRAGLTPDFIGRDDGLPGLGRAYGLRFREVRALLPAVKYQALAAGEVDVIDGYATDGLIARYDLVVLEDDRGFFPPYEAAALVGPGSRRAASGGGGGADRAERPARRGRPCGRSTAGSRWTASPWRASRPTRWPSSGSLARSASARDGRPRPEPASGQASPPISGPSGARCSALTAAAPAARGGLARWPRSRWRCRSASCSSGARAGAEAVIRAVGVLQTIPGIALLAFMIPLLGIGVVPALVALFLYSLYPILRNTYTGVRDAAPDAVGAAHALGMTPRQVLRHVRLPLAAPLIMAGIRTAAVINVGTATLAAFIGAGGLGDPIASGLALSRHADDPLRRPAGRSAGAGGGRGCWGHASGWCGREGGRPRRSSPVLPSRRPSH